MLVDDGVQVGVEVDIVLARLGAVERSELVVRVACLLLDLRLGRKIVGIVVRQFDAEIGEVFAPVAGLDPRGRFNP
jgi:hypothetical protein